MNENEKNTATELTDAELEQAAGGGMSNVTEMRCGKCNYTAERAFSTCPQCGWSPRR